MRACLDDLVIALYVFIDDLVEPDPRDAGRGYEAAAIAGVGS